MSESCTLILSFSSSPVERLLSNCNCTCSKTSLRSFFKQMIRVLTWRTKVRKSRQLLLHTLNHVYVVAREIICCEKTSVHVNIELIGKLRELVNPTYDSELVEKLAELLFYFCLPLEYAHATQSKHPYTIFQR